MEDAAESDTFPPSAKAMFVLKLIDMNAIVFARLDLRGLIGPSFLRPWKPFVENDMHIRDLNITGLRLKFLASKRQVCT